MITDKELKLLFSAFGIKCQGIFLKDQLADKKIKQGYYIFNLDSKANPVQQNSLGTHWVSCVCNDKYAFYFDSYGVLPPTEIEKFIKTSYEKFAYNNYIIQDMESSACGHYCLALAIFVKVNQSKYPNNLFQCCNEFINMFGDDAKRNDSILRNYLASIGNNKKIAKNVELLLERI
jgi:hypothetical protein